MIGRIFVDAPKNKFIKVGTKRKIKAFIIAMYPNIPKNFPIMNSFLLKGLVKSINAVPLFNSLFMLPDAI